MKPWERYLQGLRHNSKKNQHLSRYKKNTLIKTNLHRGNDQQALLLFGFINPLTKELGLCENIMPLDCFDEGPGVWCGVQNTMIQIRGIHFKRILAKKRKINVKKSREINQSLVTQLVSCSSLGMNKKFFSENFFGLSCGTDYMTPPPYI